MSAITRLLKKIDPHPGEHFKDKAIAVGLAFMLWFAINTEEAALAVYPAVPVDVANVPEDLAIAANWQGTLSVRAQGSERDLSRVSEARMGPLIDLSTAVAGENIYPVLPEDLNVPSGVSIQSIDPPQIRIVLENRVERYLPVSAVVSGEPASGYEVVGRRTDPEMAWVSGPRSAVDSIERVPTAIVDVSGRRAPFSQRVALVPENPLVSLLDARTVDLEIDIVEQPITQQFDAVRVIVVNNEFRVTVNPQQLDIVLRGPPSLLEQLNVDNLQLVVDAADLAPRADDYLIEPAVQSSLGEFGDLIEVVARYPQREINVHVYDQPGRR